VLHELAVRIGFNTLKHTLYNMSFILAQSVT